MLKVKPSGKQTYAKNRRPYRTQMENATFAHFMKKSMHLKSGFLSDYQVVFLLLNGPHIEESLWFYLLIDRFMTSERRDTLILPFTSKTGQSVAQNRQKIFLFGLY